MKFTILLALLAFSFSSFACNREAQFIGTVKNLSYQPATATTVEHFSFQIKIGFNGNYWFQPSGVCPMWEDEAEEAVIKEAGMPSIKNGDSISGVLVFDQKLQDYKVD